MGIINVLFTTLLLLVFSNISLQQTISFQNTTVPIPYPGNIPTKVYDGYFGDPITLQNTIYSVLYIQFLDNPQNFLYSFDSSLNFQRWVNLTDYQTKFTIGYSVLIGVNSTLYFFSSLPTQKMLSYDISTGEIKSANLFVRENAPFSDGTNLYLAGTKSSAGNGIGTINPDTLEVEDFTHVFNVANQEYLYSVEECKMSLLYPTTAFCFGTEVRAGQYSLYTVSIPEMVTISAQSHIPIYSGYCVASDQYQGQVAVWMQWNNLTAQYLSALDENMEVVWIKENLIFPTYGMINVGNSLLLSGKSGIFVFNGETGQEEKLYSLPDNYAMSLVSGYPSPVLATASSTQSLYSWSWENTLERFESPVYWNMIEISQ